MADRPTTPDAELSDAFIQAVVELDESLQNAGSSPGTEPDGTGDTVRLRKIAACLNVLDAARRMKQHRQCVEQFDTVSAGNTFDRFRVIRKLGQGGCGIVYLAEDPRLARKVALKVPRPDILADEELQQRFLREARAAAALNHPNLLPILETGRSGPICYMLVPYCEGPSLAEWLAKQGPANERVAARIVRDLALAIDHAHRRAILHRDIKPANVLLEPIETPTEDGFPYTAKLTDFGLAKVVEHDENMTRSGAIIGTVAYMAPEQATGRTDQVGTATDIYALGVLLYELLTGEKPFSGVSDFDTLTRIVTADPKGLRAHRPEITIDLEAVCLKCLEKSPADRYASAADLAEDLLAVLENRPVRVRRASNLERMRKWTRRHPAAAALVTLAAAGLILLVGGSLWFNARLNHLLSDAVVQRTIANQERQNALASKQLAEDQTAVAQRMLYTSDVGLAYRAYVESNVPQALELLRRHIPQEGETDNREFAWYYVWHRCHGDAAILRGHDGEVYSVVVMPDGGHIASAGSDGTVRLWDIETGEQRHCWREHGGEVNALAVSDDGAILASAADDQTIRFWDPRTYAERFTLPTDRPVYGIDFCPTSSSLLASVGAGGAIRIWDLDKKEIARSLDSEESAFESVEFSPDGKFLCATGRDGGIYMWNLETGAHSKVQADGNVFDVAYSTAAPRLVTTHRGNLVTTWNMDTASGALAQTAALQEHDGWVQSVAISACKKEFATAGQDGTVRVWTLEESPKLAGLFRGHNGRVWSVGWAPNGAKIVSGGADGTVRIWEADNRSDLSTLIVPARAPVSLSYSSASDRLAVLEAYGGMQVFDGKNGQAIGPTPAATINILNLSPDGNAAFGGVGVPAATKCWYWNVGQVDPTWELECPDERIDFAAFSPDGRTIATADYGGTVRLIDAQLGTVVQRIKAHDGFVSQVLFFPDGLRLLSASNDRSAKLWALPQLEPLGTVFEAPGGITWVSMTPDDRKLIVSSGRLIHVVDLQSRREVATLIGSTDVANLLTVSPDGCTLVSGNTDSGGFVKLWDLRTYRELLTIPLEFTLAGLAFNHDGSRLFIGIRESKEVGKVVIANGARTRRPLRLESNGNGPP